MTRRFARTRVGFLDHYPRLTDAQIVAFHGLLMMAPHNGPEAGTIRTSWRLIAARFGWSISKVSRVLLELQSNGYIRVQKARNGSETSTVEIRNFSESAVSPVERQTTENEPNRRPTSETAIPTSRTANSTSETAIPTSETATPYIETPTEFHKEEEHRGTSERALVTMSDARTVARDQARPAFEAWYRSYPRKAAKTEAAAAFAETIRTPEDWRALVANTRLWTEREFVRRDSDRIPYPATFLRSGSWAEPPEVHRPAPKQLKSAMGALRNL